jgi:uncharacterized protein
MPAAKPPAPRNTVKPARSNSPEVVDPAWLLKALVLTLIAALVCAWLCACYLVYQGEWQLVLHPTHTIDRTPASAGLAFSDVRFDASETGQPRLTGWWIPAQSPDQAGFAPRYAAYTVLYLHDGSGSLSDTVPMLARLHAAGLNVFAFDYRGFGSSDASVHPSADRTAEDTSAALQYLTSTRHISAGNIIPYGTGFGASLAANLARTHSGLPAVILDNPVPDPAAVAAAAHPSKILPVRFLFGDQFKIAEPLASLATPKLLIAGGLNSQGDVQPVQILFQHAASPHFTVTLPPRRDEDSFQAALNRFLDQYMPTR